MYNRLSKRVIVVLLLLSMLVSMLNGCGSKKDAADAGNSVENKTVLETGLPLEGELSEEAKEQIIEPIVTGILENLHLEQVNNSSSLDVTAEESQEHLTKEEVLEASEAFLISDNWEDYVGDVETFVYSLIVSELGYRYDVFPGCVELEDGTSIYGIAYTDYTECYTNEDGSVCYFTAGLLPLWEELEIPQEEFDRGLLLRNLDFETEDTSFVLVYGSSAFQEHCVVYGQYVTYGIDEAGRITYQAEEYVRGQCDESLGTLYSYDECRNVWIAEEDLGNYLFLSGTTLSSQIEYALLEQEINAVLKQQDFNFASVDVESYAYFAQDAVTAYLLSLQEETFLGYKVEELVRLADSLDPLQCLRITDDGIMTIDLKSAPKEGADLVVQWLVGTSCVLATAVGMVATVVCAPCPMLSVSIGAVTGIAIEVFMQVVMENQNLEDVSWNRVVLAAATGAVSGFLGPYVSATLGNTVSAFWIDSALDGLLGGVELAANAWLDGESGIETIKAFGYGMALGSVLSAGFKGVCKIAANAASMIALKTTRLEDSVYSHLTNKVSQVVDRVDDSIDNLAKQADSTVAYSKYMAKEMLEKQVAGLPPKLQQELREKVFRLSLEGANGNGGLYANYSANNIKFLTIIDLDGNYLEKETLKTACENAKDGEIIGKIIYEKDNVTGMAEIVKMNGAVSTFFDKNEYCTFELGAEMSTKSSTNREKALKLCWEKWRKDSSDMPGDVVDYLKEKGIDTVNMSLKDLTEAMGHEKGCCYDIHENIDLRTVTWVPAEVHHAIYHWGGRGYMREIQSIKLEIASQNVDQLIDAPANYTPAFAQ